jgi:hypothetical protein
MGAIVSNLGRVLKTENKFEMIVNLMEEISKQYGMKKATFYPISSSFDRVFRRCTAKERNKYVHSVPYADEKDGMSYNLLAIAKSKNELCTDIAMKSIAIINDFGDDAKTQYDYFKSIKSKD